MGRRALLLGICALYVLGCRGLSSGQFQLSGSITASERLRKRVEEPNTMLFIVASNGAGVPVAVKRIVNPRVPLLYQMREEDLVLPGPVWQGPLMVKVYVNTRGTIGTTEHGDMVGAHPAFVHSGEKSVDVVVNREI